MISLRSFVFTPVVVLSIAVAVAGCHDGSSGGGGAVNTGPVPGSLVIKVAGQEIGNEWQVSKNTATALVVERVESNNSRTTLAASQLAVGQSPNPSTSGTMGTDLSFRSTGTVGDVDVTISESGVSPPRVRTVKFRVVETPNNSGNIGTPGGNNGPVLPTGLVIKDQATGVEVTSSLQVAKNTNKNFVAEQINSDGSRRQLSASEFTVSQDPNPSPAGTMGSNGTFASGNPTVSASVNVSFALVSNPGIVRTFTIQVVDNPNNNGGGAQPAALVQDFNIQVTGGIMAGPGVPFPVSLTGTLVGGGALTDRTLIHWAVTQSDAVIDRTGNLACFVNGQQIKVKAWAVGAVAQNGQSMPNGVVVKEISFQYQAPSGSLDMTMPYPVKTASFVSSGNSRGNDDAEPLYAYVGLTDVSTSNGLNVEAGLMDAQNNFVLGGNTGGFNGTKTAEVFRGAGNRFYCRGLNEGNFDLRYTFQGKSFVFRRTTIMGDIRKHRDNAAQNLVRDPLYRCGGYTRSTTAGRVIRHDLFRVSGKFAVPSGTPIKPGYFGPGVHTGGTTFLPGYTTVDPLPSPVEDISGNNRVLFDRQGNEWRHYTAVEFTPALNATAFAPGKDGVFHIVEAYGSASNVTTTGVFYTSPAESTVFYEKSPTEKNFAVRNAFPAWMSNMTADQFSVWAMSEDTYAWRDGY